MRPHWLAVTAFFYIGLANTYGSADVRSFGFSAAFLLAIGLGLRRLPDLRSGGIPSVRYYLPVALLLAIWIGIGAIAAWDTGVLYEGAGFAMWLVVLPGLASWFSSRKLRNAFVVAAGIAAAAYCIEIIRRVATTGQALDASARFLGANRNAVAGVIVFVLPFLLAGRSWMWLRGVGVVVGFASIAALGSRASLLAGLVAVVVMLLLGRSHSERAFRITSLLAGAALTLVLVPSLLGAAGFTVDRIGESRDQSVSTDEELRSLVLRKALDLTFQHPFFGVGFGRFEGTYSPVLEEASYSINRGRAINYQAHNTFAEASAELGVPGGLLYMLVLATVVWEGVRARSAAPAPTAALISLIVWSTFHSALGGNLLLLALALVLGASSQARLGSIRRFDECAPSTKAPPASKQR